MAANATTPSCIIRFTPLLLFWDPHPKVFNDTASKDLTLAPFATTYLNYDPNAQTTSTSVQSNWDQSSSAYDNINPLMGGITYTVNDQCTLLGVRLDGPGHNASARFTATYPSSFMNLGSRIAWESGTSTGGTQLSSDLIYSGEQSDPGYYGTWDLPGLSSYLTIDGIQNVGDCYLDLQSGVNSLTGAKALTLTGSALPYTLSTTPPAVEPSPTSPPPAPASQPTIPVPQPTSTNDPPASPSSPSINPIQESPQSTAVADTLAPNSDDGTDATLQRSVDWSQGT